MGGGQEKMNEDVRKQEPVLVLCPPNMTVPNDGPKGVLGDRIHQLPALKAATDVYDRTYVWPNDPVARAVFESLQAAFLPGKESAKVIELAKTHGVGKVICLYADPSTCPPGRVQDCEILVKCHEIATAVAPGNISMPNQLDPRGRVSLWKRLLMTVRPEVRQDLQWPTLPFLSPTSTGDRAWARDFVSQLAQPDEPVLVVSPLSGAPKGTVTPIWWEELVQLFHFGKIIVPVHDTEVARAETLFGGAQNVRVIAADISKTSSLAGVQGVHVLGVDGGRMNVLAASRSNGVLTIYGEWPAPAWAMPNVVTRGPDMTPYEALIAVP
jgi:hypothetical protein